MLHPPIFSHVNRNSLPTALWLPHLRRFCEYNWLYKELTMVSTKSAILNIF